MPMVKGWEASLPDHQGIQGPPVPTWPPPPKLDKWLSLSLDSLIALLKEHTPVSRPSHYAKPWWTPHLTTHRRAFHKAARVARKQDTSSKRDVAKTTKSGYFKAIKSGKNTHWSSFLLNATLKNRWMAKKFAFGRTPTRFPSLPEAETPEQMNDILLDHFFSPKVAFSPPPWLRPHTKVPLPNNGGDRVHSRQMLPHFGLGTRWDPLLHQEAS